MLYLQSIQYERLDEANREESRIADIQVRPPVPEDATAIADLIARSPPLDLNSTYCYLLQCTHFSETCTIAEADGLPVGFVSAHRLPHAPNTLFVWQVAVAPEMRGRSLGRAMILDILTRPYAEDIDSIHATVTAENGPSMHMFCSLARRLATTARRGPYFDEHLHFSGRHPSELLINIGPFRSPN